MFLGMAISWGVSKIFEGIDNLIHAEEKATAILNVKYPDTQKDTTTYITISNDVLIFYYIKAHHLS